MEPTSRRRFIQASAAIATAGFPILGANDKCMCIVGLGGARYLLKGKLMRRTIRSGWWKVWKVCTANVMAGVVDNLQDALFLAEHDRDLPQALTLSRHRQEYKARTSVYAGIL